MTKNLFNEQSIDTIAGWNDANGVVDVVGYANTRHLCTVESENLDIRAPATILPTYEPNGRHKSIFEKVCKRKQNSMTSVIP